VVEPGRDRGEPLTAIVVADGAARRLADVAAQVGRQPLVTEQAIEVERVAGVMLAYSAAV